MRLNFSITFVWLLAACLILGFSSLAWPQDKAPQAPSPANQTAYQPAPERTGSNWLSKADLSSKVIATYVGIIGALIGLPAVLLSYKKTRAEIRKLELEAAALAGKGAITGDQEGGVSVQISDSTHTYVNVTADPRFLGPLLLLLDFIFASITLTLTSYFLNMFRLDTVKYVILFLLSGVLLVPIAREVRRVRNVLRPKEALPKPPVEK